MSSTSLFTVESVRQSGSRSEPLGLVMNARDRMRVDGIVWNRAVDFGGQWRDLRGYTVLVDLGIVLEHQ